MEKDFKRCTFGESWDKLSKKCDIENKMVLQNVNFENVSPLSYSPQVKQVKKRQQAYSLGQRYKRLEELQMEKYLNPGPAKYEVKDDMVKN